MTAQEARQVEQLKTIDREVRQHERAHQMAGGVYSGSASYEYQQGPDGQRYAVAGEVPIDYGEVAGDPSATIEKMQQVISAALAPADPSPKDHQAAAQARQRLLTAQLELAQQQNADRQSAPQAVGRDDSDSAATQRDPRVERYTAIEAATRVDGTEALLRAVA